MSLLATPHCGSCAAHSEPKRVAHLLRLAGDHSKLTTLRVVRNDMQFALRPRDHPGSDRCQLARCICDAKSKRTTIPRSASTSRRLARSGKHIAIRTRPRRCLTDECHAVGYGLHARECFLLAKRRCTSLSDGRTDAAARDVAGRTRTRTLVIQQGCQHTAALVRRTRSGPAILLGFCVEICRSEHRSCLQRLLAPPESSAS